MRGEEGGGIDGDRDGIYVIPLNQSGAIRFAGGNEGNSESVLHKVVDGSFPTIRTWYTHRYDRNHGEAALRHRVWRARSKHFKSSPSLPIFLPAGDLLYYHSYS